MNDRRDIKVVVNGRHIFESVEPRLLLSDFLRQTLGLTGTHVGCEHGVCGACTILFDGHATRSCLMFAVQAHGHAIETIEGLAESGAIHELQQAFMKHHALQCGFCTPGMLVVAYDLLKFSPMLSSHAIREGMSAALCRCTGYWNILKAVEEVANLPERRAAADERPPEIGARPI